MWGAWRRWLSRRPVKPEAAGSSPVAPVPNPFKGFFFRAVAQGLARSVRDREVGGSNPPSPIFSFSSLFLKAKCYSLLLVEPNIGIG